MAHFERHSKSIKSLVDVTEAMLHAMEKHDVNPEAVANRPGFSVLIHFLKSIIDGELNIPNELTDSIRNKSEELGLDFEKFKRRLH